MKAPTEMSGKEVRFSISAEPGSRVFVAGTFNNWDSNANELQAHPDRGQFHTALLLPPGKHEYKFVVNGTWTIDPTCHERTQNTCGSENCVLHV